MPQTVNVADAKARLSHLIACAEAGEAVIIARDGGPAARIRTSFCDSHHDALSGGGRLSELLVLIQTKIPRIMAEPPSLGMERNDYVIEQVRQGRVGIDVRLPGHRSASTGPAYAACISQSFGTATYYTCDGKAGVSQRIGGTTVHNFGGKTATSHTVGTTTIHNVDGEFGVSQKIGGITVHSGPLFDSR